MKHRHVARDDRPIPFTVAKTGRNAETFGALWARFMKSKAPTLKPSSVSHKESAYRAHLHPRFGARDVSTLRAVDFGEMQGELLDAGASRKTVNNISTVARTFVRWLAENGFIDSAPKIPHLRCPPDTRVRGIPLEAAERIVASADPAWRPFFLLLARTGLRIGEALALRWADVDIARRVMIVQRSVWRGIEGGTKSGRARTIPLAKDLTGALEGIRGEADPSSLVFPGRDGACITVGSVKHPLWRACDRAGVRRVRVHTLRHTFISAMVNDAGVPIRVAQVLAGHSTVGMTEKYSKPRAEQLEAGIAALERLTLK